MQGVEVGLCVTLHPDDDGDLFEEDVVVVPTVQLGAGEGDRDRHKDRQRDRCRT